MSKESGPTFKAKVHAEDKFKQGRDGRHLQTLDSSALVINANESAPYSWLQAS